MKLTSFYVLFIVLSSSLHAATIITFSDIGFDLVIDGNAGVYKESVLTLQSSFDSVIVNWRLYVFSSDNTTLDYFVIGVNETSMSLNGFNKFVIDVNLTIEESVQVLMFWLNISVSGGHFVIFGNSTITVFVPNNGYLNDFLLFLYFSLYVSTIAFLVYRRLKAGRKKNEELLITNG